MSLARHVVPPLFVLALGAGCSESSSGGDGGNRDAPQDLGGYEAPAFDQWSPDWAGICDPTDQNCAGSDECVLDCDIKAFACKPTTGGTGAVGADCTVGSCAKGLTCVRLSADSQKATCREWCREDKDCPTGKMCSVIGVMCPGVSLGWLCYPP